MGQSGNIRRIKLINRPYFILKLLNWIDDRETLWIAFQGDTIRVTFHKMQCKNMNFIRVCILLIAPFIDRNILFSHCILCNFTKLKVLFKFRMNVSQKVPIYNRFISLTYSLTYQNSKALQRCWKLDNLLTYRYVNYRKIKKTQNVENQCYSL